MKIIFLQGWTSTPGGKKPTFLKKHGHKILNPVLPEDDYAAAIRIAQEFDQNHPNVVVGSSRGGVVAMNINSGDMPLVLLCSAWKKWGTATTVSTIGIHDFRRFRRVFLRLPQLQICLVRPPNSRLGPFS